MASMSLLADRTVHVSWSFLHWNCQDRHKQKRTDDHIERFHSDANNRILWFLPHSQNEPARPSGGSRISGNGVHMYEGAGVRFDDFISLFLNIP